MENHKFQVNLSGIIDILANHLYSDEAVFIRELLQNATDAITARKKTDTSFAPLIEFELINEKGVPPQLIITDNGIGLSVDEVHSFLSVIGASSKKDELFQKKEEFIGQFGIGLLSCFVIADEIVMISQSAKNEKAVEWRGKNDGTYSIKVLELPFEIGTRIFLTAKTEQEHFFQKNNVKELLLKYGNFLKYPVHLSEKGATPRRINKAEFPWETKKISKNDLIRFGESFFEMKIIDCIPLHAQASNSTGYAFIGATSSGLNNQQNHSVYLNRMFLSDRIGNLLPEWVFFAKCIINSSGLRPTASRESFVEDKVLAETKKQFGDNIIEHFYSLKLNNPDMLNTIINRHHIAIKLAAISSDDFFKNICSFVPFETNKGIKTVQELLDKSSEIKYTTDVDEYRKIASVAANQSIEIVNAGYVYEPVFFEKLSEFYPETDFTLFNTEDLVANLKEPDLKIRDEAFDFLLEANRILLEFGCDSELRMFLPENLPAIYFRNEEMNFIRKAEKSKDVADGLWVDILDAITNEAKKTASSRICFNYNNPVIKQALTLEKGNVLTVLLKMLYVQTLLTGRHPLHQKEMDVLTGGLYYLIEKVSASNE